MGLTSCRADQKELKQEIKKDSETAFENVISFFIADVDQDGEEELLTIEANIIGQMTEENDLFGNTLCISDSFELNEERDVILRKTDTYRFDMGNDKPLRVQAGDVDGDGKVEISVVTYKTTKYHPVLQKRPFFYRLTQKKLEKVWLGSRLSRPFLDFALFDVDGDLIDEIVAIEYDADGGKLVAIYDWEGFGFDLKYDYVYEVRDALFPEEYHEHLQNLDVEPMK